MSNEMTIVITDAGIAEVINAEHSGTAPVILSEIGLGTGKYTASASQTALESEFKRLSTIAGGSVGDNTIHVTVNDNSTDSYTVYEVGIYTASGTLFAVYSQTTPIIQKAAASEILMAVDIVLTNIDPDSVTVGDTNFNLAPATTSRQGIVELATADETITGSDDSRAVTPAGLSARGATTSKKGLIEIATELEALAKTDGERAITPATLAAVIAEDNKNDVHINDTQEITGAKTFSSSAGTGFKSANLDSSTIPSSNVYGTAIKLQDKNGVATGYVDNMFLSNGLFTTRITAVRNIGGTNYYSEIRVCIDKNGQTYVTVPTPAANADSAQVVTATWVRNLLQSLYDTLVHRAEAETITGEKTFSTSPQVPTAAADSNDTTSASTAFVKNALTVLDNNAVHKTGNETIDGYKTFKAQVTKTNERAAADTIFVNKNTAITKGTAPSANVESRWRLTDSSTVDSNSALIAGVNFGYNTSMRTSALLQVGKPEAGSTDTAAIGIYYPATGDVYTSAPTPAAGDNSTKIATTAFVTAADSALQTALQINIDGKQATITGGASTITSSNLTANRALLSNGSGKVAVSSVTNTELGYLSGVTSAIQTQIDAKANDADVVKTTGNQNIGGNKTFTNNITIKKNGPVLQQDNTNLTKGTAPSANINNYSISYRDNNGKTVGSLLYHYNTNKDVHARLYAYKSSASTDTADVYLRVYYNANGNHGLIFSTENTESDTNESLTKNTTSVNDVTIPCMGWVNSRLSNRVGNWGTVSTITSLTSTSSSYTMPAEGYISPKIKCLYHQKIEFLINNEVVVSFQNVGGDASDDTEIVMSPIPVAKGDILKYTTTNTNSKIVEVLYWSYR